MGRTIIQPIGPLYGEAVNGTVFGRPNGSIFVPSQNTIDFDINGQLYVKNGSDNIELSNSLGIKQTYKVVAQSQDMASNIVVQISTDSDFDTILDYRPFPAGGFNYISYVIGFTTTPTPTIVNESKYYIRAVLVASTNVPVAVSEVYEVTGYAE